MSKYIIINGVSYQLPVPTDATNVDVYQIGDYGLRGSRYIIKDTWHQIVLDEPEPDTGVNVLYQGPERDSPKMFRDLISFYNKKPLKDRQKLFFEGHEFMKVSVAHRAVSFQDGTPEQHKGSEANFREDERVIRAEAAATLRRIWTELNDREDKPKESRKFTLAEIRSVATDADIERIIDGSFSKQMAIDTWNKIKSHSADRYLDELLTVFLGGYHCLSF